MTVRVRSVPPRVSSQTGSRHLPLKQGTVSSSLTWRTNSSKLRKEVDNALRKATSRWRTKRNTLVGQPRILARRTVDAAQRLALAMLVQARRANAGRTPRQRQHGRFGDRDEGCGD